MNNEIIEPFAKIGKALIAQISEADCVPDFQHIDWEQACKEFAYSYQFDQSIVANNDALIITPFTENESNRSDDCNCSWDIGLELLYCGKVGKDLTSKLPLTGNHERLSELMAMRNWLKRLLCTNQFQEIAGHRQVFNQPGEIINDEQAYEGVFTTQLIVGYDDCERRDWCDSN